MKVVAGAALAVVAVVVAAAVPVDSAVPALASAAAPVAVAPAAPLPVDDAEVLLAEALPADEAVDEVGIAALVEANAHIDAATVAELVEDPAVHADEAGRLYVVDTMWAEAAHGHEHGAEAAAAGSVGVMQAPPVADVFALQSRPGSTKTIFLDFDGATYTGTLWNDADHPTITATPYDSDGAAGSFSNVERLFVYDVWSAVAEDFAPFDVNVTTADPGAAAVLRNGWADEVFGVAVQIGPKPTRIAQLCGPGCLGIAYVAQFDSPSSALFQPAWVFPGSAGSVLTADIVSHEVGHTLGLSHDGKGTLGYYGGHGNWSPIMGNGAGPVDQFSIGDYSGATNSEDDFAVMSVNGIALVPDDFPNTVASAAGSAAVDLATGPVSGLISTRADVDVVKLTLPAGSVTLTASPSAMHPNLDVKLELWSSNGTLLASADPTSGAYVGRSLGMGASVTATVAAGTHYAVIDGVGAGSPLATGYSDYGSVGRFELRLGRDRVDVSVVGAGSVSSSPAGVSCTTACSLAMPGTGAQLTLTATPGAGQSFVR